MGTDAPTTIFIPVHRAPKKAPCAKCGNMNKLILDAVRRLSTAKRLAELQRGKAGDQAVHVRP